MNSAILVAFATKTGSTEEVAHRIADVLRMSGLDVEVQPANKVKNLGDYRAVALGAALYVGRLHKDARRFLSVHKSALQKLPVALFVLGPVQKEEKEWIGAQDQLERQLKSFPWFAPVARSIVGGRFDAAKLGFPFNMLPALKKIPASDARDWKAIEAFASELASKFQSPTTA